MKETCNLTVSWVRCSVSDLDEADVRLVEQACQATYRSYAPYSRFYVGAALRLDNGATVSGSNQENAAFGAGTCAERCALFYAGATYPGVGVHTIAIAARGSNGEMLKSPISPCGICRQALIEAQRRAGHAIRVIMVGQDEVLVVDSVSQLLPLQFDEIS